MQCDHAVLCKRFCSVQEVRSSCVVWDQSLITGRGGPVVLGTGHTGRGASHTHP